MEVKMKIILILQIVIGLAAVRGTTIAPMEDYSDSSLNEIDIDNNEIFTEDFHLYDDFTTVSNEITETEITTVESTTKPSNELKPFATQDHSYFVLIEYENEVICFGSLIGNNWALSAASCTVGKSINKLKIRASFTSSQDGQIRHIRNKYEHPEYDTDNNNYNIVILWLHAPITTYTFKKILYSAQPPPSQAEAITAVISADNSDCQEYYCYSSVEDKDLTDALRAYKFVVDEYCCDKKDAKTEFCVTVKQAVDSVSLCEGRIHGSPLIIHNKLYGVYSSDDACSSRRSLYTNISDVHEFIKRITHIPPATPDTYLLFE